MRKNNIESDLSTELTDFVEQNFNKQLLFLDGLHPSNVLLYQLWKYILQKLFINIEDYKYIFAGEFFNRYNFHVIPFTTKIIKDLDIKFTNIINDQFYIDRYNKNKKYIKNFNISNF